MKFEWTSVLRISNKFENTTQIFPQDFYGASINVQPNFKKTQDMYFKPGKKVSLLRLEVYGWNLSSCSLDTVVFSTCLIFMLRAEI